MTNLHTAWIFNLALKLAIVVCLGTLAFSLAMDIEPLTALLRSGTAFMTFVALAWAVSIVWKVPDIEEKVKSDDSLDDNKRPSRINEQSSEIKKEASSGEVQATNNSQSSSDDNSI
jgi:hypothetical protein